MAAVSQGLKGYFMLTIYYLLNMFKLRLSLENSYFPFFSSLFSMDWAVSFTSNASVPDQPGICRFWSI